MNTAHPDLWYAPPAGSPVDADVQLPGSKSITNRAMVLAALATTSSVLRAPLRARDTQLMADALRSLGHLIEEDSDTWRVVPATMHGAEVDCGGAGTVMRFIPPLAVLARGDVGLDGDPRVRERPMGEIVSALRALGGVIHDEGRNALPFTVAGAGAMPGGTTTINASSSSQFISGLLLSGARYQRGVTVHHDGTRLPSTPHIEMTVSMLRQRDVRVDDSQPLTWRVEPGPITALDTTIEPDLSNAAPFLAAGLLTGGRVRILGWPALTSQPGDALRDVFGLMGAHCRLDTEGLTLRGPNTVEGVDLDLSDVGELTPVIAAVAALAHGPSRLRGVAHLRGHETDRLAALATELTNLGGQVTETEDGLEIRPRPLRPGTFRSYDDHRMAQAGAVLGLMVPGVQVEDIQTTRKTLADFPGLWTHMLGQEAAA